MDNEIIKDIAKKKIADPTVVVLATMFSEDFLRDLAKKTDASQRERKIDIVKFFWVLLFCFGLNPSREIRRMKRIYESHADVKISISSFYCRFSPELVEFLHQCVFYAIEYQTQNCTRSLSDKLKVFRDLVIQDSTIIRLHEKLRKKWPAARSRTVAAGIKVSCVVSAVSSSMKSLRIVPERTSEIKTLRIGAWVRDRVILLDLGFFKYAVFEKINRLRGYFVSRLKDNSNPKIVKILRGNIKINIQLAGKKLKLKDILPYLDGEIVEAVVEVGSHSLKYLGKKKRVPVEFRMVAVFNKESKKYHIYITNIPQEMLSAEDVAALYGARWEIEIIFKELKSSYRLDEMTSSNPEIIKCMVWVAILVMVCSNALRRFIIGEDQGNAQRHTRLRWAKIFAENAPRLLKEILDFISPERNQTTLYMIYSNQTIDPNKSRKHLMDQWIK